MFTKLFIADSIPTEHPTTPTKTLQRRLSAPQNEKLQPRRDILRPKKTPKKENEENFVLKSPKKPLPTLQIAKPDSECSHCSLYVFWIKYLCLTTIKTE